MKKRILILVVVNIFISLDLFAQLPSAAQALYDEAYNNDTMMAQTVLNHGAQVFATPDSNSFYLKWFPNGVNPAATPLIVTLHGSNGNAFIEFKNWYTEAQLFGCGIIALQWYRGAALVPPNDYFNDTIVYADIDSALRSFNYPPGKALLHGFSRGSARSYAQVFLDSHGGQNYFCTILSNAGAADSGYPLYAQIDSGIYGSNVFAGKDWALYCGGQDTNLLQSGCPGMSNTQTWLLGQGASVGMFIQDQNLGHDGFHTVPAYIDSVLNYYLNCFNGNSSILENISIDDIKVYPNPFSTQINIAADKIKFNEAELTIQNAFGQIMYRSEDEIRCPFTKIIDTRKFASGIYFLHLNVDGKRITREIIKE